MNRFKLVSTAFATAISVISTAIILSCNVDLDKKDGESSDSGGNSGEGFCVNTQTQQCFTTQSSDCLAGLDWSDFCPYSNPPVVSSSSGGTSPGNSSGGNVTPSSSSTNILPGSSSSVNRSSSSGSGVCNITSGYCLYSGPDQCWPMPTDDCCENGTIVPNQAACSSTVVKFCNWGTCVGGNGWECSGGGGCYAISTRDTEANCIRDAGTVVDCCPDDTRPPSANFPQCSISNSSLLWDLSIHNTGISTGGGWFNFYDKNEAENPGNSFSVFYDKISEGYVNQGEPQNNGYPTPVDLIDWSGEVSFYLDNTGEYPYAPYAGIGFVWINGNAAPQVFGSHTGLCIEYSLSGGGDYNLQFNVGDYAEWNDFRINIPKQALVGKKFFDFSLFRQQEGWGKIISLSEAKAHSIGMSIQGNLPDTYSGPAQEGKLVLKSIHWDSCNY